MKNILIYLCILAPLAARAQTVLVASPSDALKYAKAHNYDLSKARMNKDVSAQNMVSARAAILPKINTSAELDDYYALPTQLVPAQFLGGRPGEFVKLQFGTRFQGNATADASMPLINTTYWNNLSAASINYNMQAAQEKSTEMDITERVYKMYYLVLLSQSAIGIAEKDLANNDSLVSAAQNRFKNGIIEQMELNRTIANRLLAKTTLDQDKLTLLKNINSLKQLMGLDAKSTLTITGNLEDQSVADIFPSFRLQYYPMYQVKQLNYDLTMNSLSTEQLKRLPELSIFTRYTKQLQTNDLGDITSNQVFDIGYSGIKLDLPVFAGFSRNAAIAKAKINSQIAQADMQDYIARTSLADSELVASYYLSRSSMQTSKEAMDLSDSNYKTATYKYQNGVYSYDQLVNVYNEQLNAQNQYLGRLADYLGYRSAIQTRNSYSAYKQ